MSELFAGSLVPATDSDGTPLSGAKWYFYLPGTNTPTTVYTDDEATVAHANPVVADSAGRFAPIYITAEVRAVLKASDETAISNRDIDPVTYGAPPEEEEPEEPVYNAYIFLEEYDGVPDGDGSIGEGTNNLAALNLAIAELNANGGTLWLNDGIYRIGGIPNTITRSDVHINGSGALFFDTAVTTEWGFLFFDGGQDGPDFIENISVRNVTLFGRPDVHVTGVEPGYDGSGCVLTLRGVKGFLVDNVHAYRSPNYVMSGLRCQEGTFSNNRIHEGTAAIQCQDGAYNIKYIGNHVTDTSDDGLAIGYWGGQNGRNVIMGNTVERAGARGIVSLAPAEQTIIANNTIRDTFLAGILIEGNAKEVALRYNAEIIITGNTVINGGMYYPPGYARGQDIACGIRINPSAGQIGRCIVQGNTVQNSRNYHIACEPLGVCEYLDISSNVFNGVGAIGSGGTATSGGGESFAPADTNYPGVKIISAMKVRVCNNEIHDAHGDGIYIGADCYHSHVTGNEITNINADIAGTGRYANATAVRSAATGAVTHNNVLLNSVNTSVMLAITHVIGTSTENTIDNAFADPTGTLAAKDSFARADVAPVAGGLGSTTTGSKLWVGNDAGIIDGDAYFDDNDDYNTAGFSSGYADVDVTVDVTINGYGARVIARATAADLKGGAAVIFDSSGNLLYWNGSTITANALFVGVRYGRHRLRLKVVGTAATAWLDGKQVQTLTVPAGTSQYVGMTDNGFGTARFHSIVAYQGI